MDGVHLRTAVAPPLISWQFLLGMCVELYFIVGTPAKRAQSTRMQILEPLARRVRPASSDVYGDDDGVVHIVKAEDEEEEDAIRTS